MKKVFKRTLSVLICLALVFGVVSVASAQETDEYNYVIESPYMGIDWDTIKQYKASLHSHTMASDGRPTIEESVEMHYALGYDILAITDHGVAGAPWDEVPQMAPLYRCFALERTRYLAEPDVLTSERRAQIISGEAEINRELLSKSLSEADLKYLRKASVDDFTRENNEGGMLEITGAMEANAAVPLNSHINTFGSAYGQGRPGIYGDYETVAEKCEEEGGFSFINHPSNEFTYAINIPERATAKYYANKYAKIFLTYDSCVAFDVNSNSPDVVTWDEVLKLTIPNGRNVSNIVFTDGHAMKDYDFDFTEMCMTELTTQEFERCMRTGAWFSVGRHCPGYNDLADSLGLRTEADLEHSPNGEFWGEGRPTPHVTSVTVDEDEDVISFESDNTVYVQWISGGEVICEGKTSENPNLKSIDLDDYDEYLTKYGYVRFQLWGPGGILYSQAFVTKAQGVTYEAKVYNAPDFSSIFRSFMDVVELVLGKTWPAVLLKKLLVNNVY